MQCWNHLVFCSQVYFLGDGNSQNSHFELWLNTSIVQRRVRSVLFYAFKPKFEFGQHSRLIAKTKDMAADICEHLYNQGWVSGTGASITGREASVDVQERLIVMDCTVRYCICSRSSLKPLIVYVVASASCWWSITQVINCFSCEFCSRFRCVNLVRFCC